MSEKTKHRYEIRNGTKVCMAYDDVRCHYSEETLKNMREHGYKLYIDGKLYRPENKKSKKGGKL